MKYRRWTVLLLAILCVFLWPQALADDTIPLDAIGMRYTPTADETCLTRDQMDAQALASLGTDQSTLLDAMTRDGLYLISLLPDGRQFSLGVSSKPATLACSDQSDMTMAEKDTFLQQLARQGNYGTALWQDNGYALFASTAEAQGSGALTYSNLSLSTLYLDRVYTFRMDIIGREADQTDTDLLLSAAERTLRLGAASATDEGGTDAQLLTLPDMSVAFQPAVLTYASQDCDLTLDPIPDTLGVTQFVISGVTVPNGNLRYSVNGKTSSRVKADDTGSFRITVPSLEGNAVNQMQFTAYKGDLKTVVSFSITVNWQDSPFVLEATDAVQGNSVTLNGLTLPGSTVSLTKGRGSSHIVVDDSGAFSLSLLLSQLGENSFTLQVQSTGYRRNTSTFTVTRAESQEDLLARLAKAVRTVSYEKLLAKPSAYEGDVVLLNGEAGQLDYHAGTPRFVLTTAQGESYTVLAVNLLTVSQGEPVQLYGTLTGAADEVSGFPTLTLEAIVE